MKQKLDELSIIDLISEKHIVLRRAVEERWSECFEEEISHTEGFLLAKLYSGKITLAEVARQLNVSRQAMYKCAKQLEAKGYLNFVSDDKSSSKYCRLTDKGEDYYIRSQEQKRQMEREITGIIGEEAMKKLKSWLKLKWI